MYILKNCIALTLLLFGTFASHSQEKHTEISFEFRVNSSSVDSIYGDNAARMRELKSFLNNIREDGSIKIASVTFCGAASPEGSAALNRNLSMKRLLAVENIVRREIDLPDSIITRNDSYIPWDYLKTQVAESAISQKEEVLSILNEQSELVEYRPGARIDYRVLKLQKLDDGKVWRQLNDSFFSSMRYAYAIFDTYKQESVAIIPPKEDVAPDTVATPVTVIENTPDTVVAVEVPQVWSRNFYLKTNAIGWALAVSNVAAEIDLVKHWSFTLPIYWSSWDYFKRTLKFRTFTIQPEVRYWFAEDNAGWFVGAHMGLGWFNNATDGTYRTQDHNGSSPALGGGVAAGYRMPICRNGRWMLEFSLGAGVYSAHYDRFVNEPNGQLVDTHKKTWFGIDQAAVSVVYRFNLNKQKGGQR